MLLMFIFSTKRDFSAAGVVFIRFCCLFCGRRMNAMERDAADVAARRDARMHEIHGRPPVRYAIGVIVRRAAGPRTPSEPTQAVRT